MANVELQSDPSFQEISSRSLTDYLAPLVDLFPKKNSQGYAQPTDEQLLAWGEMIAFYRDQDWSNVVNKLSSFEQYKLVLLHDETKNEDYYILVENSPFTLGWGVYVQRANPAADLAIHVNHPLFDTRSWLVGSEVFQDSKARYLFIAGAHRYANGNGSKVSDMARNRKSVFQKTHETVSSEEHYAVSIHGYTAENFNDAISESDIVLSSGQTDDAELVVKIDQALENAGLVSNTFDAQDNRALKDLSGRINPQLQYSNTTYGEGHFVHVEIESRKRSPENLHTVSQGIVEGLNNFLESNI